MAGVGGDSRGRAGLGHRLVAWTRVRAVRLVMGSMCLLSDDVLRRVPSVSCASK